MSTYTQDITHLINKINANVPDNDTQAITAARIRDAMGAVAYNYDLYVLKTQLNEELGSYVLKTDLDTAGYVTASQLEGLVTNQELQEGMQSVLDDSYAYVVDKISDIPVIDPSLYVTQNELSNMGYVTQSQLTQASYINTQYLDEASYTTLQEVSQQGFTTANDFKTINGYSLIGEGDIVISGGGSIDLSAYVDYDSLQSYLGSYVTKDELSAAGYVTNTSLQSQLQQAGYLTSIPSDYVTQSQLSANSYVTENELSEMGYVSQTQLNESSYITMSDLNTELGDYPTNNDLALTLQDYVSYSQFNTYTSDFVVDNDLEDYVTKSQLTEMSYVSKTELSNAGYITSIPSDYATYDAISQMGYITLNDIPVVDLSSYVTKTELSQAGYLTSIPSEYVTETELSGMSYATQQLVSDTANMMQQALLAAKVLTIDPGTGDLLVNEMATENFVIDYVDQHAPTPDLSTYVDYDSLESYLGSYVTKTELSAMGYLTAVPSEYVTESEITSMGYVTNTSLQSQLQQAGYVSQTQLSSMTYVTTTSLQSTLEPYVTQSQLSANSYITSSDIPAIPVIDESIIPNTTATYTLGDSTHLYSDIYINRLNGAATGMWVRLGGNGTVFIGGTSFRPATTNTHSLGTSSNQWSYTYSAYFIENGTNIKDIYTQAYVLTQNQYDGLSQADKDKETIYIISDQQAYMNNELVTETSLDSRGFLTAANFNYDPVTQTLVLNL